MYDIWHLRPVTLCKQLDQYESQAGQDHHLNMFPGPPTGHQPLTYCSTEGEDKPSNRQTVAVKLSVIFYRTPFSSHILTLTDTPRTQSTLMITSFSRQKYSVIQLIRYNYSILINHQQNKSMTRQLQWRQSKVISSICVCHTYREDLEPSTSYGLNWVSLSPSPNFFLQYRSLPMS